MPKNPPMRHDIEIDGHKAHYFEADGLVTVVSVPLGRKSATPGPVPELQAKHLLRELIKEGERRGIVPR